MSVGASFQESAAIGSTGMTLGSGLVTRPSDASGERPIADAFVITP